MKTDIEKLKNLLDALSRDMGWQIIIEDFYAVLRPYELIANYMSDKNWHTNPYCLKIKKNTRLWQRCVNLKAATTKSIRKRGEPGWSICYCGVAEYTYPIFINGIHIGTVVVTGYFSKLSEKMSEILSKRVSLSCKEFSNLRIENLKIITKEEEQRLFSYISVVADFIECIAEKSPIINTQGEQGNNHKQKYIRKALDYIEKHYFDDISPESVAKRCHISVSYLQHLFIEFLGEGVASNIRRKRLERACQLLIETDRSVSNIAFSCGFYSPDYFSSVFKRSFNMTPLAYRKSKN